MLAAMKTILAAFVSIGFFASAAMACPGHDNAEAKSAKKEEAAPPKQATAPKATPAPAPAPVKPAPAPAKTVGSKSEAGGKGVK